jgi:GTP cyclohydrolase I
MAKKADPKQQRRVLLEQGFSKLVQAFGIESPAQGRRMATRCATLWAEHLLVGEGADLQRIIGRGQAATCQTPVCITGIGIYLVCPHHLTVAFGEAHIAYVPDKRLLGFGALSRLAQACTAKLVLQEAATQAIADALATHLGAASVLVRLDAMHPCHNLPYPRSHRARAITEAHAGARTGARALRSLMDRTRQDA